MSSMYLCEALNPCRSSFPNRCNGLESHSLQECIGETGLTLVPEWQQQWLGLAMKGMVGAAKKMIGSYLDMVLMCISFPELSSLPCLNKLSQVGLPVGWGTGC